MEILFYSHGLSVMFVLRRRSDVAGRITSQAQRITSQAQKITSQAQRITSQAQRITSQAQRITSQTQRITSQAQRITSQTQRITSQTQNHLTDTEKFPVLDFSYTCLKHRAATYQPTKVLHCMRPLREAQRRTPGLEVASVHP